MRTENMSNPLSQAPNGKISGPGPAPSQPHLSLESRVAIRLSVGLILAALILFLPAGTFRFWQAWAFLALVYLPTALIFIYFLRHDRAVVERRLQNKERHLKQRRLMRWSKPFFLVVFLLPGLDHRLGWSRTLLEAVPLWLTLIAEVMALGSILLIGWVIKINKYASRTVQVVTGQTVISAGPYCLVRHPLYAGSLVLWIFAPLALGSFIALPAFALLIPFYVVRLLDEEKTLRKHLAGYAAYCRRTPFRLVPFVW